jgi:NAD(P)-dependent dehydrogenase (short-subunit alcohol dehydrogenase family)
MAASRVWLITGASSGIGLELALLAARKGDRVLAASRNPAKLKSYESSEKDIKAVYLDHNEPLPQIKAAIKDILAIHGTVDMVVNNAAYVQTGTIEELTPEETLRQFQANTLGPLNVYRALLPHLRQKGSGTLVTIGSMAAWYPMAGCNLYNGTKAALRWLVIGLAGEVAQFGIHHCLVEPGFFRTELLNPAANIASTPETSRLPAYTDLNATNDANFAVFNGNQLGDPIKGATIIFDVVTSSGVAAGRELPELLPLGSDASEEISKAASKTIAAVEEWRGISALSDIPHGK